MSDFLTEIYPQFQKIVSELYESKKKLHKTWNQISEISQIVNLISDSESITLDSFVKSVSQKELQWLLNFIADSEDIPDELTDIIQSTNKDIVNKFDDALIDYFETYNFAYVMFIYCKIMKFGGKPDLSMIHRIIEYFENDSRIWFDYMCQNGFEYDKLDIVELENLQYTMKYNKLQYTDLISEIDDSILKSLNLPEIETLQNTDALMEVFERIKILPKNLQLFAKYLNKFEESEDSKINVWKVKFYVLQTYHSRFGVYDLFE